MLKLRLELLHRIQPQVHNLIADVFKLHSSSFLTLLIGSLYFFHSFVFAEKHLNHGQLLDILKIFWGTWLLHQKGLLLHTAFKNKAIPCSLSTILSHDLWMDYICGRGGREVRGEKPTRKEEVVLLKVSKWNACFAEKYNFSNNFRWSLTQNIYRAFQNEASPSFVQLRVGHKT